jgi:signal transduction histidine kinase/CheY-like chemotaxis protein
VKISSVVGILEGPPQAGQAAIPDRVAEPASGRSGGPAPGADAGFVLSRRVFDGIGRFTASLHRGVGLGAAGSGGSGRPETAPHPRPAEMMPSDKVADPVYAEQVAAVFRQTPIALSVNLVIAALTASVLTPIASRPLPPLWFGAVVLVTAARWMVWRRYRSGRRTGEPQHWALLAACGAVFAGLSWGLGATLMTPLVPAFAQTFLAIVVCGMCAGAIVVSVPHLPVLLAFVFSATLPLAVRFFGEASATDRVLGAMTIVFAAALAVGGRELNRIFAEGMRLRLELNEANLRLQAEITEHRATEAVLRQAQKFEAVAHLTGGIAHDFNNLLTVVIGNLLLAKNRAAADSELVPLLDRALQSAERGVALIQRLLGFARRQHLDPRPIDLRRLVSGIEPLLRQTLGQAIDLSIVADAGLAPAQIDSNQLELAILNLAINARDAMPAGGILRIALENRRTDRGAPPELGPGEYAVISIADTGAGMDEATLARAFEPFFTTKEAGVGSGLGLPMVQGFVAQSGGATQIRSRLHAGTTVELWLPKADAVPASAPDGPAARKPEMPRGAAGILLCDDDADVRRFISEFLASKGYAVHAANDGGTALNLLARRSEIELLIADYAMPGINGLETIRQAKARRLGLKALLITGYAVAGDTTGIPLLRKPFAPSELARRVAEILTG